MCLKSKRIGMNEIKNMHDFDELYISQIFLKCKIYFCEFAGLSSPRVIITSRKSLQREDCLPNEVTITTIIPPS